MTTYTYFIIFIIIIKVIFVVLAISHVYLKIRGQENSETDKKVVYWKERLEFVFKLLMSILLIALFNPRTHKAVLIEGETKILLYLFGFVLIITANWEDFFKESKIFKEVQMAF
jgi:uncharacterized membrane protein YozB (DUF420 family)